MARERNHNTQNTQQLSRRKNLGKSLLLCGRKKAAASTKFFNGTLFCKAANYTHRGDGVAGFFFSGKQGDGKV
jgi:hypothetical protein